MSAGLPIVATAVGDIALMVAEENEPFIVQRDDQRGLVRALAELSGNPELRRRLGRANRRRVELNFPIETMATTFQRIVTDVIGQN
jgi:glycosyltransferase involved in cell wall biosynthesis